MIGSLLPNDSKDIPKFTQIYFISDKEEQIETRTEYNEHLKSNLIDELQTIMETKNSYVKSFKYALQKMDCEDSKVVFFNFFNLLSLIKFVIR